MRQAYDISSLSHICGDIGRIQTVQIIPVEAGCSLELNISGLARLSPTRKEIVSDCQVDLVVAFWPHRGAYGQTWVDFIKAGIDEGVTFPGSPITAGYRNAEYLTLNTTGAELNRSLLWGYNSCYYNLFSNKSFNASADGGNTNDLTFFPQSPGDKDERCRKFGRLGARLPHVLCGATSVNNVSGGGAGYNAQNLTIADQTVPVNVGAGTFTLGDLAATQGRYKSQVEKAWFQHNYQDVIGSMGGKATKDADPRNIQPTLIMRHRQMLSGKDIDGTDTQSLGSYQGKTMDRVALHMPRKLMREHGFVYIFALFRYPLVHNNEAHPLLQTVNWNYDQIAGNADRLSELQPEGWTPDPWLTTPGGYAPSTYILQPYGQHYRFQSNRVHSNYQAIPGYPFSNFNGPLLTDWLYYQNGEYDETFQTPQIGQWQMSSKVEALKYTHIPGVKSSIFAGAN